METVKILTHSGVRPNPLNDFELISGTKIRRRYFETYPEGGGKYWNDKLLKSGCNEIVEKVERWGHLIWCPVCQEWCNENQFVNINIDKDDVYESS